MQQIACTVVVALCRSNILVSFPFPLVLLQHHCVRIIPVSEVRSIWKAKEFTYIVYGDNRLVYTDSYPQTCCWPGDAVYCNRRLCAVWNLGLAIEFQPAAAHTRLGQSLLADVRSYRPWVANDRCTQMRTKWSSLHAEHSICIPTLKWFVGCPCVSLLAAAC